MWDDHTVVRNGRSGQRQNGVDIYGRPQYFKGDYAGIQCKDREVKLSEIEAEISKAEEFKPALKEFTFAVGTTNEDGSRIADYPDHLVRRDFVKCDLVNRAISVEAYIFEAGELTPKTKIRELGIAIILFCLHALRKLDFVFRVVEPSHYIRPLGA